MLLTAQRLHIVCPKCKDPGMWALLLESTAIKYGIDSPCRAAMWLAQLAEESGQFNRLTENLNYSAESLLKTWPKRFTASDAASFAHDPPRIANRVYGGRMGNDTADDGWTYRGRGLAQLTGKDNYRTAGTALGLPLLEHPEMLESPSIAAEAAGWFWRSRGLSILADADRFDDVVKTWNGGFNGLDNRKIYWTNFKKALI